MIQDNDQHLGVDIESTSSLSRKKNTAEIKNSLEPVEGYILIYYDATHLKLSLVFT